MRQLSRSSISENAEPHLAYYFAHLKFHLLQLAYGNILELAIDIYHNCDGYCTFRRRNGNREECEEVPLVSVLPQHSVEHCEVEVGSIEHEFDAEEYCQGAPTCEEAENAGEHHHCGEDKNIVQLYHGFISFLQLLVRLRCMRAAERRQPQREAGIRFRQSKACADLRC